MMDMQMLVHRVEYNGEIRAPFGPCLCRDPKSHAVENSHRRSGQVSLSLPKKSPNSILDRNIKRCGLIRLKIDPWRNIGKRYLPARSE